MKNYVAICSVFLLSACLTKEYRSGVPMRASQIEQVKSSTTKKEVYDLLGSPASVSFVGAEKWFYYTAEGKIFAFLDPMFSKYEVLTVKFNSDDSVNEIKLKNISDSSFDVDLAKKTELPSEIKLNFFQELFGNIGKFNSSGLPSSN
ncbi:outer membrane protein assembly factor BamE [bacterium]|nr:outer membrane protein assembly factor BamE [bacterium]